MKPDLRALRSGLASPAVALAGLVALAAWPVMRAGYPTLGDGLPHFYRLVEFDHLLRQGVWFPRWATDLCYGYGCPLFNFYPPLAYYLGALFHALGLNFAHSLLAVYGVALALAVTGAYALARERWEVGGGLLAAGAYGLSPYLYFDILARGALPETLGLGVLPWVLWAFYRLAGRPSLGGFVAAALLYAGLLLTHLLGALLAAPLVALFVGLAALRRKAGGLQALGLPLLAAGFSFLLAAYFILPAALETGLVQIQQLTTPGDLDFHNHFLALADLLALPRTFDARLVFISVPPSLSLAALALALLGLYPAIASRLGRARASLPLDLWGGGIWIALAGLGGLTLPLATPLWERLPLVNIIQFPWRLVGPASLLLALLAAAAAAAFVGRLRALNFVVSGGLTLLFFYSLPWSFAPAFAAPATPTVRDFAAYEAATGQLGMTSTGEFLPREVHALPAPDSLQPLYAMRLVIDRLAALPAGVTLVSQSATLTSAEAVVEAAAPAVLTFNFFYFPGWRATVDGQPASLSFSDPQGLITVPVAGGQHTVVVRFGLTPLRAIAVGLSWLGLLILAGLGVRLVWARRPETPSPASARAGTSLPVSWVTLGVAALWLVRVAYIDGQATPFAHSRFDGVTVARAGQALDVNFDNQLVLIGADLPLAGLPADAAVPLTLYWRAQNPPAADYATSVQVVDAAGNLFGQSDSQHPGRVPTSRWRLDQYAQDAHRLTLLPGTPPGVYQLRVTVYQVGGAALDVLDENQMPQGQAYDLGPLTVTRASRTPQALDAQQLRADDLGSLKLIGQTLDTPSPQAGDEVRLTLFWRVNAQPLLKESLLLELVGTNGQLLESVQTDPMRSDYARSAWMPGEVLRAPLRFRIPASAPAGTASLRAGLVLTDGRRLSDSVVLAALDVRVPVRSFAVPALTHPRADVLGGQIKLLGYDLTANGITLYWQALTEMDMSYTVFVHALSTEGGMLAQTDALPANSARATTGWLAGEVVADAHTLALAGAAEIEVGLYNAQTRERLGTVRLAP